MLAQTPAVRTAARTSAVNYGNRRLPYKRGSNRGILVKDRQDVKRDFGDASQQYNSGVARIVVGGNERLSKPKKTRELRIVNSSPDSSRENTLYRVSNSQQKPRIITNKGSLQFSSNPRSPTRQLGDGSNSPLKHMDRFNSPLKHEEYNLVEEEFMFLPTESNNMTSSLRRVGTPERRRSDRPSQTYYLADQTNVSHGLNVVNAEDSNTSSMRRRGQYGSIQEYEEAQRNKSMSSSSGLKATSGSENIAPQLAIVLKGNEYTIHHTKANQQNRSSSPARRDRGWQVTPIQQQSRPIQQQGRPVPQQGRPVQQYHGQSNTGLRLVDGGNFSKADWKFTSRSAPSYGKNRAQVQKDTYVRPHQLGIQPQQQTHFRPRQLDVQPQQLQQTQIRPSQLDIQPQQLTQQLQMQPSAATNQPQTQPRYRVQNRGKGDNYLKNEALEYDDDHKYYRQHGQRVKKTSAGEQQLFLDSRVAETNDVIGNQMVKGKHAQKVHSGESVGTNHHSKFHSEVRVSHKTSHPANAQSQSAQGQKPLTRKNSQPVRVTTHQWPPIEHFEDANTPRFHFTGPGNMNLNFHNNFAAFQTEEPLQRLFKPDYNPRSRLNFNPGFQKFFQSIDDFGPQSQPVKMIENGQSENRGVSADPNAASVKIPPQQLGQAVTSPRVEYPSDNETEGSSIRSSASAYWPPELKFKMEKEDDTSWKFHKPALKLRRKPVGINVHQHQRRVM